MKIIHCSDLHLGSKINGLPSNKRRERRNEVIHSFERLADYASSNDVRAIIIAGDMFDDVRITNSVFKRVISCIKNHDNVDFLYLSGNHEEDSFIKKFKNDPIPVNLKLFGNEWTSYDYKEVVITGINSCSLNTNIVYDTLQLDENRLNVCCMHGQIAGYLVEKGKEVISLPRLKNKGIDYLALGHYHFFMEGDLDERGKYVYSGCLEGRGFDETGEKGFVLIDIENNTLKYQFMPFACKTIHELIFDVTAFNDGYAVYDEIVSTISAKYGYNDLIKVVLKGEHKSDFVIDLDILETKVDYMVYFAKVVDKTTLAISLEDYATDKSVRGEFVRAVLQSELSDEEKNKVILLGLSALRGEIES